LLTYLVFTCLGVGVGIDGMLFVELPRLLQTHAASQTRDDHLHISR
jgi:hypothetical protein